MTGAIVDDGSCYVDTVNTGMAVTIANGGIIILSSRQCRPDFDTFIHLEPYHSVVTQQVVASDGSLTIDLK